MSGRPKFRARTLEDRLWKAVMDEDVQKTAQALRAGAYVDTLGLGRSTPLLRACQQGSAQIVELLVQWKADVNKHDNCMATPLGLAESGGWASICQTLFSKRAAAVAPPPLGYERPKPNTPYAKRNLEITDRCLPAFSNIPERRRDKRNPFVGIKVGLACAFETNEVFPDFPPGTHGDLPVWDTDEEEDDDEEWQPGMYRADFDWGDMGEDEDEDEDAEASRQRQRRKTALAVDNALKQMDAAFGLDSTAPGTSGSLTRQTTVQTAAALGHLDEVLGAKGVVEAKQEKPLLSAFRQQTMQLAEERSETEEQELQQRIEAERQRLADHKAEEQRRAEEARATAEREREARAQAALEAARREAEAIERDRARRTEERRCESALAQVAATQQELVDGLARDAPPDVLQANVDQLSAQIAALDQRLFPAEGEAPAALEEMAAPALGRDELRAAALAGLAAAE